MPVKSRFTRLDAFTKTVEDARIRTTSGGVVTIASIVIIIYLVLAEWADYRKILVQPELIVDKGRGMHTLEACLSLDKNVHVLTERCRRENGNTPQHHVPPNTLRIAH